MFRKKNSKKGSLFRKANLNYLKGFITGQAVIFLGIVYNNNKFSRNIKASK